MLISSTLPTSAAWQTAPIPSTPQVAPSVRTENGPAPMAQPAHSPAAQSFEHTASDRAQQKDATGAEAPLPIARRGQVKTQGSQSTDNFAANSQALPTGNAAALPFQAVLSDVLPQAGETLQQLAKQTATAQADVPLGQDLAKAPADVLTGGKARTLGLDPTFQITKEAPAADGTADLHEKLATGEMAFAARVVSRASGAATEALRDPETVISASRWDAGKSSTTPNADASSSLAAKKSDAPGPPVKTAAGDESTPAGAGSQTASDAGSNQESGGQSETGAVEAVPDLRATAESQDTPTGTQPAQQNMAAMGTPALPSAEANLHNALPTAKSAEPGAPQLLESQGESAASRAGESVHSISLRLASAEQGPVQVRLSERAGELHVTVRTPDTSLTRGLRDGLPDLMSRLQVNGYRAETWQPGGHGSNAGQDRGSDAPGHGNSQQRQGGGNQQNAQDEQQPDEQTPQWVRELESSIQRSNSPWPASPAR